MNKTVEFVAKMMIVSIIMAVIGVIYVMVTPTNTIALARWQMWVWIIPMAMAYLSTLC